MPFDTDVEHLLERCLRGDRGEVRDFVDTMLVAHAPDRVLMNVMLPALERVQRLDREDAASQAAVNIMIRAMRLASARVIEHLDPTPLDAALGPRRISLYCGTSLVEELQGEIFAAVLEHDGHVVRFSGGGVPADEILEEVGRTDPDVLLLFASSASDAPSIREVIDSIRTIDSRPNLQIAVGGGVFGRAPGLAEEIGADLWADEAEVLRVAIVEEADRRAFPEQRTVGRTRRLPKAA
jgi:hypothetical protein